MFQSVNISIIIWGLICIITMYHVYTCSFLCWLVVIASSSQVLNIGQMRSWEVFLHRKLHSCSLRLYCHRLYPDEELGGPGKLSSYSEWKKPDLNFCFDEKLLPTMLCCLAKAKTHFSEWLLPSRISDVLESRKRVAQGEPFSPRAGCQDQISAYQPSIYLL